MITKNFEKIIFIPDLHLFDKEIGSTMGYPKEGLRILDNIISITEENSINKIIFGGDVFHGKISSLEFLSEAMLRFRKLNELTNWNVYSIKGNHDISSRIRFMPFDFLKSQELLKTQEYISCDRFNYSILLFDYANNLKELQEMKSKKIQMITGDSSKSPDGLIIGVFHNNLVEKGYLEDINIGTRIDITSNDLLEGLDVAIINHIHADFGYRNVVVGNKTVKIFTPGSLCRTSIAEYNQERESGCIIKLEISKEEDNINVELGTIEIPFTSSDRFFNYEKYLEVKRMAYSFEQFSNSIENINIKFEEPISLVMRMDLEEKVVSKLIEYLSD